MNKDEKTHEFASILRKVDRYYTVKLQTHGPTSMGVDWNSRESQELRFDQLLKVCDRNSKFSINDYGCGYGSLYAYMTSLGFDFKYLGIDVSEEMIKKCVELHGSKEGVEFFVGDRPERTADYAIASGIFNVKLDSQNTLWKNYILEVLQTIDSQCTRGFAFNCLTSYSDREFMREDLYYADPCELFDYCKRNFSKNVALLHDYGLYEFTMIVRK